MSDTEQTLFEAFLNNHDDAEWRQVIRRLLPDIHEVDRNATEIWFHFFPLVLLRALKQSANRTEIAHDLVLAGNYELENQIDSSHRFLYGHRYWPHVKATILEYANSDRAPASIDLAGQILSAAGAAAERVGVERSLMTGITAVGFMTLQQAGLSQFKASPGIVRAPAKDRSPARILRQRAKDDSQGLLGFLRGAAKVFTVTFDESHRQSTFPLISTQHLTTAAASDKRDHHLRDQRCILGEGPIPVQCRSASCGTCWVGVLAGGEKLSEVTPLEKRRMKVFGYIDTDDPRPLIRLACRAMAYGNISIVIPPWNGVFGKLLDAESAECSSLKMGSTP